MAKNGQISVKELATHLIKVLKEHPEIADKLIVVGDDNEGNGFHGLFYGLTFSTDDVKQCIEYSNGVYDSVSDNPSKIVILG